MDNRNQKKGRVGFIEWAALLLAVLAVFAFAAGHYDKAAAEFAGATFSLVFDWRLGKRLRDSGKSGKR